MNIDAAGGSVHARQLRTIDPSQARRARADFADAQRNHRTFADRFETTQAARPQAPLSIAPASTTNRPTPEPAPPPAPAPLSRNDHAPGAPRHATPAADQSDQVPTASARTTPTPTTPSADINADGRVDVFDFAILASSYASDATQADLDSSGTVDEIDLAILKKSFGQSVPATTAPERSASPGAPASRAESAVADRAPASLPGDINADGRVDVFDFGALAARFGSDDAGSDLNADGTVDDIDLAILKQNFGRSL